MSYFREQINKILLKIKQGEYKYKNILVSKYWDNLLHIAFKYARNKSNAEDILMKSFTRCFRYIHRFDETQDGYNWLYEIIKKCAFTENEKEVEEIPLDNVHHHLSSEDFSDRIEVKIMVETALKTLPQRAQTLIELRIFEDMTYKEIAKKLGMQISNAHKQTDNAMALLIEKLRGNGGKTN